MKKLIVLLLASAIAASLIACGDTSAAPTAASENTSSASTNDQAAVPENTSSETSSKATQDAASAALTETPAPVPTREPKDPSFVNLGDKIETETVSISFDSLNMVENYSMQSGEETIEIKKEGHKVLLLNGMIKNSGEKMLADAFLFFSATINGDYNADDVQLHFENDLDIFVRPDTEVPYHLAIFVPNEIANAYSAATISLAFNNDLTGINNIDGRIAADNVYELRVGDVYNSYDQYSEYGDEYVDYDSEYYAPEESYEEYYEESYDEYYEE